MPTSAKTPTKTGPRYHALAEHIRHQIQEGILQPGDRLPTFSELRVKFDTGPHTIDRMYRLLEDEGLVIRRERQGIFVTSPEKTKKTGIIGLLGIQSAKQEDPYYLALLSGIQDAAFRAGQEILLLRYESPTLWEKVDGVLMVSYFHENLQKQLPPKMKSVSLLYTVDEIPSVVADDFGGAEKATQYLIENGHRRIAYLARLQSPLTTQRIAGYQSALRQAGITPDPNWLREIKVSEKPGENFSTWGQQSMTEWLEDNWRELGCTALLAQNDLVAASASAVLQEAGFRVPQDVSLIGFDNLSICDCVTPRLTSVEVPLYEIGMNGVELLLREMEKDKSEPLKLMLPTKVRVRQSTGAVALDSL